MFVLLKPVEVNDLSIDQFQMFIDFIIFQNFSSRMGQQIAKMCGNSDFFQKLLEQYGDDFVKLILAEKAKQTLQEKFKMVMAKLKQMILHFKSKINGLVDEKIALLKQKFEELKDKVNDKIPGGIPFIEKQKGQSINEFSGLNKMVDKIDNVRDQFITEVDQRKGDVENQLMSKKTMLYNEIEEERPKVPLYESLPDQFKSKVLDEAEEKFKEQIQERKQKEAQHSEEKFVETLKGMDGFMNKINPQNFLTEYVDNAVEEMVRNTFGDGIGGTINGFMDKVF